MEKAIKHHASFKIGKIIYSFTVYGYIFLFMYTGYDKLMHIERFIHGVGKIPYAGIFAEYIGWGIPLIEIILALLLIFLGSRGIALKLSVGLMGIFIIYLSLMLLFAENRMCYCGGVIQSMGWTEHLIFNLIWLLLGLWAIRVNQLNDYNKF